MDVGATKIRTGFNYTTGFSRIYLNLIKLLDGIRVSCQLEYQQGICRMGCEPLVLFSGRETGCH